MTAALAHAALMMGGFPGTVIGIERAVAVKLRTAFLVPAARADCVGRLAVIALCAATVAGATVLWRINYGAPGPAPITPTTEIP